MDSALLWRIVGAACLLFLGAEWLQRPRPEKAPITIAMSDRVYARDSVLGSAYIEFRTRYRIWDGSAPNCASTPGFTVERQAGDRWLKMQTVRRTCAPHQFDGNRDMSVTWHTRLRVPGRYRIQVAYASGWRAQLLAGPTFTVR